MGNLEVQTRLIDLFLAELEQLQSKDDHINFNNTSQFDALLTFLENLLNGHFTQVPSQNVLHILLTLACRYPRSSWTHDPISNEDGIEVISLYMKEVNDKYNHSLSKDLLQLRSVSLLNKYIDLLLESKWDEYKQALLTNLQAAFRHFCTIPVRFGRPRSAQNEVNKPKSPVAGMIENLTSEDEANEVLNIIDSDLLKYQMFNLPSTSITSLSDIGSKTTGLGEATSLFQNMPHLLAQATPEPEAPEDGSPATPKPKKRKSARTPIEIIKIFDDNLIANMLSEPNNYSLWDLLRWALTICDDSSKNQLFLFDSSRSASHGIWKTYCSFFFMVFRFLKLQHDYSERNHKMSFLKNLLTQLGAKQDWYRRLVNVVFTGVGLPTQEKSYPCYLREKALIRGDAAKSGLNSINTSISYKDNDRSMTLRAQIIATYLYQESDRFQKLELVMQISMKLVQCDPKHILHFLNRLKDNSFVPENVLDKFIIMVVNKLIVTIAGSEDIAYNLIAYLDTTRERIEKLRRLFESKELYEAIVQDSTYKSMKEFQKAWDICVGLCAEMIRFTIDNEVKQATFLSDDLVFKAEPMLKTFEERCTRYYIEFIESKSSDLIAEDDDLNFILEPETIELLREQYYKDNFHDRLMNWVQMFRHGE